MKTLCVYCSSSDRLEPKYYEVATQIGAEIARRRWTLVYGGGRTGLMGTIARSATENGGRVVGVIPEFMKVHELEYREADELISVATMRPQSERYRASTAAADRSSSAPEPVTPRW